MARNDASSFASQIDAELKECNAALVRQIVAIAVEGLESVIDLTPVDTGLARGSWFVIVGEGSTDAIAMPAPDKDGARTLQAGLAALLTYGADGKRPIISIRNSARQIHVLEHGGGALRRMQWSPLPLPSFRSSMAADGAQGTPVKLSGPLGDRCGGYEPNKPFFALRTGIGILG